MTHGAIIDLVTAQQHLYESQIQVKDAAITELLKQRAHLREQVERLKDIVRATGAIDCADGDLG